MKYRIFTDSLFFMINLINSISVSIARWALIMKEFSNFYRDDIILNWEAWMECGHGDLFFCASVERWNLISEPVGIGGVLRNNKSGVPFMFSKYIGVCNSNKVDVLAISEALQCFLWNLNGGLVWRAMIPVLVLSCQTKKQILERSNSFLMRYRIYL